MRAVIGFASALVMLSAEAAIAQTRPAANAQPRPAAQRPAPAAAAQRQDQPIARATFIANMDVEFRKMDADKNGIVTRAELEGFERAISVLDIQKRNRALFVSLDRDRNGQISATEFARLQTAAPPPNVGPKMAKFDANRDQRIGLVEYRAGTLTNFDRLDTNKDGYVSAPEMKAGGIGR